MTDIDDIRLTATYAVHGRPAVLTVGQNADAEDHEVTAIDMTAGAEVQPLDEYGSFTIRPAAAVRMTELAAMDIAATELNGSEMEINGKSWRVQAHQIKPGAGGESAGEVYLILAEE